MVSRRGTEGEEPLGAVAESGGVRFRVWSSAAERVWVCIYGGEFFLDEVSRHELVRGPDDVFSGFVPGIAAGARYGLRADGPNNPERGLWFDPHKLLVDPYAVEIDYPYQYRALLAAPRWQQVDTAPMMPKAIVPGELIKVPHEPPRFPPGGFIYELAVRSFTRLHPDIPPEQRGTLAALAHPAVIGHLKCMGVHAVELMPIAAWIDERHLQPLGLTNAWGYNPVTFMALNPRLAPGGLTELRETVSALHAAGIGVILDVVFNHTGESDRFGPTLSLRGLDNRAYYRHAASGELVNDTGTGNTLDADSPVVQRLVLDTLRHFVRHAGIDGFRFDLATIIGRGANGFDPHHPLLAAIEGDPDLHDRVLFAEPWDIGPGGYQLGRFSQRWLEWNDRYRDDVRRFWRGDEAMLGTLGTRMAGSSDIFSTSARARSVNFVAAHDGMALADIVAFADKHNEANGEDNRDGHNENFSWNRGEEGVSLDRSVNEARRRDRRALLATLFASRGPLLLTAGDEFGRTQSGNNNAYCQDNAITWLDWTSRDTGLEAFVRELAAFRAEHPALHVTEWLTGRNEGDIPDVEWRRPDGAIMQAADWEDPAARSLSMLMASETAETTRIAILINGSSDEVEFVLPDGGEGWFARLASSTLDSRDGGRLLLAARGVAFIERLREDSRDGDDFGAERS